MTVDSTANEQVAYDAKGKRDPFVPLASAHKRVTTEVLSGLTGVQSIEEIVLEGVVYDPEKGSMVVANGSVLTEGEKEGDVRVVQIKQDGVVFEILGKTEFKPFSPESTEGKIE